MVVAKPEKGFELLAGVCFLQAPTFNAFKSDFLTFLRIFKFFLRTKVFRISFFSQEQSCWPWLVKKNSCSCSKLQKWRKYDHFFHRFLKIFGYNFQTIVNLAIQNCSWKKKLPFLVQALYTFYLSFMGWWHMFADILYANWVHFQLVTGLFGVLPQNKNRFCVFNVDCCTLNCWKSFIFYMCKIF